MCWGVLLTATTAWGQTFQRYVIDPAYDIHFTTALQLSEQRARLVVAKPLPMGAVDYVWVINFNPDGTIAEVWQYGGFPFSGYVRGNLVETADGLRLTIRDNNSTYLLRLDDDGTVVWARRLPDLRGENRSMLATAGGQAMVYGDMIIGDLDNSSRRAYFTLYDAQGAQQFSNFFFLRDRPELNLVTRDIIAADATFYLALVEGNASQSGVLVHLDRQAGVLAQRTFQNAEFIRLRRLPGGDLLGFGRRSTDGIAFLARLAPDLTPRWFRTVELENDFLQHSFSYLVVDPSFGFWLVTRSEIGMLLLRFDEAGQLFPGGNVLQGAVPWGAAVDEQQQLYLALSRQTAGRDYPALCRFDPQGRTADCPFFEPCMIISQDYSPENFIDPVAIGNEPHGEPFVPDQGSYALQLADFCLEPYRLDTEFTLSDPEICVGETISATAMQPSPGSVWSFPGGTPATWTGATPPPVRLDSAGTIPVRHRVTTLGCTDSLARTINVLDGPEIDLGPDQTLCRGETYAIEPSLDEGAEFAWSDGFAALRRTGEPDTEYAIVATDARGCRRFDTLRLELSTVYELDLGPDTIRCAGETHTLVPDIPAAATELRWQDGSGGPTLTTTATGTYQLAIADARGCRYADSAAVRFLPVPEIAPLGEAIRCAGRDTLFSAVITGDYDRLRWSDGTESADLWLREPGTYRLEVSLGGCSVADSLRVREENCLPPRYYPTAFSPNGDGTNDRWEVFGAENLDWLDWTVYDRWGGTVFRERGAPDWHGRDGRGQPLAPGPYLIRLRFRIPNPDLEFTETAPVQLLR
jgi:gliding motility-associated-like protein